MIIYNEAGQIIEDPDYNLGHVDKKIVPITHTYVVDIPAVTHEVVVAEYPETGGKDVDIIVDEPEIGHWVTVDEHGKLLPEFDGDLSGFPHDVPTEDTWEIGIFVPFTQEELAEREQMLDEATKNAEFQESLPEELEIIKDAQDDMVLLLADIVGGAI